MHASARTERERQHGGEGERRPLPHRTCRITQVLPEIAEQVCGRGAWGHGDRWMRLSQRCYLPRQEILVPEIGERQTRRLLGSGAPGNQLPPAVLEVLRELLDDLVLACRQQGERREPRAHVLFPVTPRLRSG